MIKPRVFELLLLLLDLAVDLLPDLAKLKLGPQNLIWIIMNNLHIEL